MSAHSSRLGIAAVGLFALAFAACQDHAASPDNQGNSLTNASDGPPASSADFMCQDVTTGGTYDNVVVEAGYACVLEGVEVKGNVEVKEGGALRTVDATIRGNIQAYGAMSLSVEATYVEGSVQAKGTTGVPGMLPNWICGSTIGGDVQLDQNYAPFALTPCEDGGMGNEISGNLQVTENVVASDFMPADPGYMYDWAFDLTANTVMGDLQFMKNRDYYSAQGHNISLNEIGQNLQCKENEPYSVADGGLNTVGGNAEDQCYMLAAP
jgi:hypothetical protein